MSPADPVGRGGRAGILRTGLVLALILGPCVGGAIRAADAPAPAPPNIVVILVDDLGYGDVGCYGATKVKTPNVDRLAREGRRFTDAHAASAVCTPSRYALLTGEYAWRIGNYKPLFHADRLIVDPGKLTVARLLQRKGYATAAFGKWHLGFGTKAPDWNGELKPGPLELGFDYYFGMPTVSCAPPFVYVENRRVFGLDPSDPLRWGPQARGPTFAQPYPAKSGTGVFHGGRAAHERYRDEEITSNLTARAVRWIAEQGGKPFFLYFASTQIHHPFTPHPRFRGSSACGLYGDCIQELDGAVGEILRQLDDLHLADRTLVVFTSDNGGMLNLGGQAAWQAGHRINGDLLGFKFDAWEGGHRVPFIVRWPGRVPAGSTSGQLLCLADLLATFAAVTGQTLGPADAPDSFNLLPAFVGEPDRPLRDHAVLAASDPGHLALRSGPWVYIGAQGGGGFTGKAGEHALGGPAALQFAGESNSDIRDGRILPDAPAAQLYDLSADPRQRTNVIREHPEVAAKLRARLQDIRAGTRTR